jgi:hypothetical protein
MEFLSYYSWRSIDIHLHYLGDVRTDFLKYLQDTFSNLYDFLSRVGVGAHICDSRAPSHIFQALSVCM